MKLGNILKNVEYTAKNALDPEITDLIYDSRKVSPGTAFFCLKGYTSDGHAYAQSAVEKGASALIISDELSSADMSVMGFTLILPETLAERLVTGDTSSPSITLK